VTCPRQPPNPPDKDSPPYSTFEDFVNAQSARPQFPPPPRAEWNEHDETHFIVPRDSTDELTFAVVHVEIRRLGEDQGLGGSATFPGAQGSGDGVGEQNSRRPGGLGKNPRGTSTCDLANQDLTFINRVLSDRLRRHIADIEVHSMDSQSEGWVYDTILVHEDQRPREGKRGESYPYRIAFGVCFHRVKKNSLARRASSWKGRDFSGRCSTTASKSCTSRRRQNGS